MEKLNSLPEITEEKVSTHADISALKSIVTDVRSRLFALAALVLFTVGCASEQGVTKQEHEGTKLDPAPKKISAMEDDLAKAEAVRKQLAEKFKREWQKIDTKTKALIDRYMKTLVVMKKTLGKKNITTHPDYEKLLSAFADLLNQPLEKVRETIDQLSLSQTDVNNIPDMSLDLEQQADLAEALAYVDMGIVITEEEKLALRKEVGLPTDNQ